MTNWTYCQVTRSMLSIYCSRDKCPHPADCQFWDGRAGGCGVRFTSEAARAELVLGKLNRLGKTDAQIALELKVAGPTVSKWRHGQARMPERRMAQLEAMLADAERDSAEEDITVSRACYGPTMAAEVRQMLRFLKLHGWSGQRVADYLGVSRSAVSQWRGKLRLPTMEHFENLAEKHAEVEAEAERGRRS